MPVRLPPGHEGTRVERRDDGAWLFPDRPWDAETGEEFRRLGCVRVWLNEARGWHPGPEGLSFLPGLNGTLRHLLILLRQPLSALDEVSTLTDLVSLTIPTEGLEEPVDLRPLLRLRDLGVSGGRFVIGPSPDLEEVRLVEDPTDDLRALAPATAIRRLVIKSSEMKSLQGIEGQPIESVSLLAMPRLEDASALHRLPHLREVWVAGCKSATVTTIEQLPGVKVLAE